MGSRRRPEKPELEVRKHGKTISFPGSFFYVQDLRGCRPVSAAVWLAGVGVGGIPGDSAFRREHLNRRSVDHLAGVGRGAAASFGADCGPVDLEAAGKTEAGAGGNRGVLPAGWIDCGLQPGDGAGPDPDHLAAGGGFADAAASSLPLCRFPGPRVRQPEAEAGRLGILCPELGFGGGVPGGAVFAGKLWERHPFSRSGPGGRLVQHGGLPADAGGGIRAVRSHRLPAAPPRRKTAVWRGLLWKKRWKYRLPGLSTS